MAEGSNSLRQLNTRFAALGKSSPQVMGAFKSLMTEASRDGLLNAGLKELIAVALAVNKGCSDCIIFHVAKAKSHGAKRDELIEVLGVCVEMGGGPAAVYASYALEAFDQQD